MSYSRHKQQVSKLKQNEIISGWQSADLIRQLKHYKVILRSDLQKHKSFFSLQFLSSSCSGIDFLSIW